LVSLIVKTSGLLLIIYTLALFPDRLAGYLLSPERSGFLLAGFVLFPVVVQLLIGAFLFSFPALTAGAVAGTQPGQGSELERRLQSVVFAGIGLYVALQGALDIAYYAALHAYTRDGYDVGVFDDPTNRANLIASVLSLFLGVALLVGARGLLALIARLR